MAKPQALAGKRPSAELPPRPVDLPSEPTIAGEAPTAVLPAQVVPRPGVPVEPEIAESQLFHRNVMAMLSGDLPRSSAAVPENPLPYQVQRKPVAPDIAPPPSPDAPAQNDQHAHVNIEELRTRIEGINLSLRALDGELSEKREFSADQLDSLLNRLDILMLRQKDLTLFRDLITPQEQAKVGQIDSSRSAVATMGTQIAALRTRVRENDSLSAADRAAALKQLDDLSDRLATLTAEK